jgi:hypothetical protein
VAWSSSQPQVCAVASDGKLTAIAPGVSTIIVSSNGQMVSAVIEVVNNVAGHWSGQSRITSVVRISGGGPLTNFSMAPFQYAIDLQQTHGTVTGKDNRYPDAVFLMTGTINASGAMSLAGSVDALASGTLPIHVDANPWTTQLDANGHLKGQVSEVWSYSTAFGPQVYQYKFEIVDLTRLAQ